MLAIVATIEHFRMYLAGGRFTVKADHLPLVSIIRKPSTKLSARLQRLSLRLQHYTFFEHIAGKDNSADYLSKHALPTDSVVPSQETSATEECVSFIVECDIWNGVTLQEIEKSYAEDYHM